MNMYEDRRRWRPGDDDLLSRTTAVLAMLLLVTMTQRASGVCTTIHEIQQDRLDASLTSATISCLLYYQPRIIRVIVNQLPSIPSLTTNGTCRQSDQTAGVLNQCPITNLSMYTCTFIPTLISSNTSSCSESYLVTTTYRCAPVYRVDATQSTGSSVSVGSNVTVLNSGVTIGSLSSAFNTLNYFSIYVPANLELSISVALFIFNGAQPASSCSSRVVFFDVNNQTVAQFCNSSSPTVNLGCGNGTPRFFRVQYVTNSLAVGVLYSITLAVPQTGKIMAQGGTPPFPLFVADSITTTSLNSPSNPPTTEAQTTSRTASVETTTDSVVSTSAATTAGPAVTTTRPTVTTVGGSGVSTTVAAAEPTSVSIAQTTAAQATSRTASVETTTDSVVSTSAATTAGPAVTTTRPIVTTVGGSGVSTTVAAAEPTSVSMAQTTAAQATSRTASVVTTTDSVVSTSAATTAGPAVSTTRPIVTTVGGSGVSTTVAAVEPTSVSIAQTTAAQATSRTASVETTTDSVVSTSAATTAGPAVTTTRPIVTTVGGSGVSTTVAAVEPTSVSIAQTTAAQATSRTASVETTTDSVVSTSAATTAGPAVTTTRPVVTTVGGSGVSTTVAAVEPTSASIAQTTAGQVTTAASEERRTSYVRMTLVQTTVDTSSSPAAGISSITTGSSVVASTAQGVTGFGELSQSAVAGIVIGSIIAGSILIISTIIVAYYGCTPSAPLANSAVPVSQTTVPLPQYPPRPLPTTINYQLDPRSTDIGPFRNVTEFYVDGNKSSTLVLNRKQEPQMYRTVIRV